MLLPALGLLAVLAVAGCASLRLSLAGWSPGPSLAGSTDVNLVGNPVLAMPGGGDASRRDAHGHPRLRPRLVAGDLGEVVLRDFGYRRHPVQVEIPLLATTDEVWPLAARLRHSAVILELLLVPIPRGPLWTLADAMRLRPYEPFVYGAETWISDQESVQLRMDPTNGETSLMVVYRLEL